jgi:membrane-bound serine protease (ClpP class)
MRSVLVFATLVLLVAAPAAAAEPKVRLVDFDDIVTPVSADRVVHAIERADRDGESLVVIRLDTPGGLVSSLERIVQGELRARTPVVAWVGPAGAKAASAGFLILIAADVAAMAPGTHTGAAAVISSLFGANPESDVGLKKASSDLAARARTLAEHRGRNVEACEKAVLSADAYTDGQALKDKVIDLVANDVDDLLRQLDGREIRRFDGSVTKLTTAHARVVREETTFGEEVLGILANPVVAYLLLLVGLGGLYVELSHPGLVFPAVTGVLCLLLFAFSAQVLPVSAVGILLILLAIVLFILEIKVVSHGMLAVGGLVCLVVGSLMLFRGPIPEMRLPLLAVLPASLTLAAACTLAVRLAVRARWAPVATGAEGLRGEIGTAVSDLAPEGKVFVHGEIWDAVSAAGPLSMNTRVRVVRVEAMRLTVEPAERSPVEGG